MKKSLYFILLGILILLGAFRFASADNPLWKLSGGKIIPVLVSYPAADTWGNPFSTSTGGGSGSVGPSTSTYVAVFNAAGSVVGYTSLNYVSSTNTLSVGTLVLTTALGTASGGWGTNPNNCNSHGIYYQNGGISCDPSKMGIIHTATGARFFVNFGSGDDGQGTANGISSNGQLYASGTILFTNVTSSLWYGTSTGSVIPLTLGTNLSISGGALNAAGGGGAGSATTTITASGTTLNGPTFTFGTSTAIAPYASGTSLYWKFASLNISQFTNDSNYLTGNQSITLTGAVTGSGATTIATTYTTSTLFAFFSATGCITFSTSTGQIGSTCLTGTKVDSLAGLTGTVGAGPYLGTNGNNLTVSSTLASSTWGSFSISSGTAITTPFKLKTNVKRIAYQISCDDNVGTTTFHLFRIDSLGTSTEAASITSSTIVCGAGGGTTQTFTSSTFPVNTWLAVTSTVAGTPNVTNLYFESQKQ